MAQLNEYSYPWKEMDDFQTPEGVYDFKAHIAWEQKEMNKLRDISDNLPEGQVVGALLNWQRGDGYACYIVTKARPLILTWIPYMDHWTVEEYLIRGLTKKDILHILGREKVIANIFGNKQQEMNTIEA